MLKQFDQAALKKKIKSYPLFYRLNALFKDQIATRRREQVDRSYKKLIEQSGICYSHENALGLAKRHIEGRGCKIYSKKKGQLKIFWVGANKEQDYCGFVQGLEKFGSVQIFMNSRGLYGLDFSSKKIDPQIIKANSEKLLSDIRSLKDEQRPDVLIGQMWATLVDWKCLCEIQNLGIPVINIAMDDQLVDLWDVDKNGDAIGSIGLVKGVDLTLNTTREMCVRYLASGSQAYYWPLGSDPDLFHSATVKDIDVCFVGSNYGKRPLMIQKIRDRGVNVTTFGPGWPNGPLGSIDVARVFGRSKIILGMGTVGYSENVKTIKLRDFDATMAGALYITHRYQPLQDLFREDKEIVLYDDIQEAADKIEFYMKHVDQALEIGARAAARARESFTWEARFAEIFLGLGFLEQ